MKNASLSLGTFVIVAVCAMFTATPVDAEGADASHQELAAFMDDGRAYLSTRYRFEHVDRDGISKQAKASTLRTRLGFERWSCI